MMGDDYANSPAAVALGRRGLRENLVGYMIYGDYSSDSPPSRLLDAVAQGAIDVAVAWGPLAGYYARQSHVPLTVTPVSPSIDVPFMPFVYEISMGVRHGDSTHARGARQRDRTPAGGHRHDSRPLRGAAGWSSSRVREQ